MFLLNPLTMMSTVFYQLDLHSTMFLLNLIPAPFVLGFNKFTFHYVSIKSNAEKILDLLDEHLHSTMFLLNREVGVKPYFLLLYLHSTMFLLNRFTT